MLPLVLKGLMLPGRSQMSSGSLIFFLQVRLQVLPYLNKFNQEYLLIYILTDLIHEIREGLLFAVISEIIRTPLIFGTFDSS